MNNFLEKWNTEPKFKTKVKLGLYTLFVLVVAIFALSTRSTISTEPILDIVKEKDGKIKIPQEYNYTINIKLNDNKYKYIGSKREEQETITKMANNKTLNYIYKDGKYFKDIATITNIIDKEEIYDIIEYNYIDLENINKYLEISKEQDSKNIVYIKDIILGHSSEKFITISIDRNKINIDYTELMKLFDKTIEEVIVETIIEEIE